MTNDGNGGSGAAASGKGLRLLRYQEDEGASSVTTERTGKRAKISRVTPRPNVVRRVEVALELRAIRLAVRRMTRGQFVCWLALREGIFLTHRKNAQTGREAYGGWTMVEAPATVASIEQVAARYGYTYRTVQDYDADAGRQITFMRSALGLTGREPELPAWAAILSDKDAYTIIMGEPDGPAILDKATPARVRSAKFRVDDTYDPDRDSLTTPRKMDDD